MDTSKLRLIPSTETVAEVFRGGSERRKQGQAKPKRKGPGEPVKESNEAPASALRGGRLDVRA